MKLTFLGATGTVTGSKYLLEHGSKKVMVDCGIFQGKKDLRLRNWEDIPVNLNGLTAIVLTHAHIDHSGYIPRLVRLGFKGKIYCTPPTRDLCKLLLPDCGYLMEEEASYANKKGFSKHKPALPLFTIEDAKKSLKHFRSVEYNKTFDLGEGLMLEFRNAGHILGSAHVSITDGSKKITFSGDIGRENDPILKPSEPPDSTDYLVMESTYGNRLHGNSDPKEDLTVIINRTLNRGGTIIIPAFAVGRTQSVLHFLAELKKEKKIPEFPIYLNSPMAINASRLYCKHKSNHKIPPKECHEMCNIATYTNDVEQSKKLNFDTNPKLIISASGMATGGRVLHHIKTFGPDKRNTLLFTGFQAAGTLGELIVHGAKSVRIHGEEIPIRAEVCNLNELSAHADSNELINWVKRFKNPPNKVFITHGEPTPAQSLKEKIEKELGWNVFIPQYLSVEEL